MRRFAPLAFTLSIACPEFVGGDGEACNHRGLCGEGLACVDGVCRDRALSCQDKQCGTVGPFECGTCTAAGEICQNYACVPACAGRECGEFQGVDCGACSGADERCERFQCIPYCTDYCGDVAGHDC